MNEHPSQAVLKFKLEQKKSITDYRLPQFEIELLQLDKKIIPKASLTAQAKNSADGDLNLLSCQVLLIIKAKLAIVSQAATNDLVMLQYEIVVEITIQRAIPGTHPI